MNGLKASSFIGIRVRDEEQLHFQTTTITVQENDTKCRFLTMSLTNFLENITIFMTKFFFTLLFN